MGVNMAGYAIEDDQQVRAAANEEIIRRYFKIRCDFIQGLVDAETVEKIELIMNEADLKPSDRRVVQPALEKAVSYTHLIFQYNTDPDHIRSRTCSQCRFRADSDDRALSLRDRAPRIWPYDP